MFKGKLHLIKKRNKVMEKLCLCKSSAFTKKTVPVLQGDEDMNFGEVKGKSLPYLCTRKTRNNASMNEARKMVSCKVLEMLKWK